MEGAFGQQGRQLALDAPVGKGRTATGAQTANPRTTHISPPEPLLEWQEGVSHLLEMKEGVEFAGFLECQREGVSHLLDAEEGAGSAGLLE